MAINFAWWNLENFYTVNNTAKARFAGDRWRPRYEFNEDLLDKKIDHLAQIINTMHGDNGPDIFGFCEVEEESLINRLEHKLGRSYAVVYQETEDVRRIDVGLLYDKIRLVHDDSNTTAHQVMKRSPTRDILEVHLRALETDAKLIVFCNHWPSRLGGQYESEPYRIAVAEHLSRIVQERLRADKESNILIMGDFNDEPFNRSIVEYLLGVRSKKRIESFQLKANSKPYLFNACWHLLDQAPGGSFWYKDGVNQWNLLDHILVTQSLVLGSNGLRLTFDVETGNPSISLFRPAEIVGSRDNPQAPKRFRYYKENGVHNWEEGYSDHFPIAGVLE